jgi:hypothetical protein
MSTNLKDASADRYEGREKILIWLSMEQCAANDIYNLQNLVQVDNF